MNNTANSLRKMLLADGRLTKSERLSLKTSNNPLTLQIMCSDFLRRIQPRLKWQDMPTDRKGNTIWPECYDNETHTWKNKK